MARKRINKNLVAFLTVMGIVLTTVVVLIATSLSANRDPEIWASQARERVKNEDYANAAELFKRAFLKSDKNANYLVEAADCYYRMGDWTSALQVLKNAQSATDVGAPGHKEATRAYLEYAWEGLRPDAYWRLDPMWRGSLLESALDMQRSDPQEVLGVLSEAVARLAMAADDPQQRVAGDAALQRAIGLNENEPWLVLARLQREQQELDEQVSKLSQERGASNQVEKLRAAFSERVVELLKAGVDANPTEWKLLVEYVAALQNRDRDAEARQVLERALAQAPEAPEIHAGMAEFLLAQARKARARLSAEEYAELMNATSEHAAAAVRLAPGLYQAYMSLGNAELLRNPPNAEGLPPKECYEKALAIYDQALQTTAGIRSSETVRYAGFRPFLYLQAFTTAVQYAAGAPAEQREQRLEWVRKFREALEGRYPDEPFTWFARGTVALLMNDGTTAIQAFENADRLGQASKRYPALWLQSFGVLPVHRLAQLYREVNEPGMALNLTEEAIRRYSECQPGKLPPVDLCIDRATLLNSLNRPQEAIDFIKQVRNEYASVLSSTPRERERLNSAEAVALSMTKRGGEAPAKLENAETAAGLLMQAKLALVGQDRETAAARLLKMMSAADLDAQQAGEGVGLLVQLSTEQDRRDEVRKHVAELRKRFADNAAAVRILDRYDAALAYSGDELDSKLLELIAAEPEGLERTRHYYEFYAMRARYPEAQKYLDLLEAADPNDGTIQGFQFTLALRSKNFARAEQYAAKLAHANDGAGADNAGGAMFRGQLALEQNRAEDAIREFRAAQVRLPRSSSLQVQLGHALVAANRIDEAVETLQSAYELNPNSFDANVMLDEVYNRRVAADRRPEDWEKYLEQAARLRPQHPYVIDNADRVDPQAGIKMREQRRAAEPQNVDNLIRLAQLYANKKVGDMAKAAERLLEAARAEPGNLEVARAASRFFGSQGKRAEGEQVLAACLENQSGAQRAAVQLILARFYVLLGDTAAAEQAFATARQLAMEKAEPGSSDTLLAVELEIVNFYRDLPGRARDTITAAHWVLDKLNPKEPKDQQRIQFARQAIIRALLQSKQLGEADKEINDYVKAFGEDPAVTLFQAQLKLAQRQWDDAYVALTRLLQSAPSHSWALLQRGGLGTRLGRTREAAEDLSKSRDGAKAAYERVPADKRGQSNEAQLYVAACGELATVYEVAEQYELGEGVLREMIDVLFQGGGPDKLGQQQEGIQRLVRLYQRWGHPEKAQQLIAEFMARNANDAFWPAQLAAVRANQGDKYVEQADAAAKLDNRTDEAKYREDAQNEYLAAVRYYDNAMQLAVAQKAPTQLMYLAYQLDALAAARRTDRAVELYRNVEARVGAETPAIVHAAMIRAFETSGQRPQALAVLEKGLVAAYRAGGGEVPAVMGYAGEYLPPDAVAGVVKGLIDRVNPDSRESFLLHNLLATQLAKMNQPAEVLTAVEPVLAKAPPNSPERLAAMVARQQALLASGQLDASLSLLEEILRASPDNAIVLNNLAYVLVDEANRPAEALPYAEKARELEPTAPAVLDTVGWVYTRNGRHEQAEAALKQALAAQPGNAAANYHLGVLYQAMGRMSAARAALQRAVECATKDKNETIQKKAQEALNGLQ